MTPLRKQKFAEAYLECRNATKAAVAAGYSAKSAAREGSRLLKDREVKAAVKQAVRLLSAKGVKPYKIFCYTLIKSKKDIPRILELDKLGIGVFAMGYMDFDTGRKSQEVIDVCQWCNLKKVFKQCKRY